MSKLYCYSMVDFNQMCKDNGWNDSNMPSNAAFISILSTPDVAEYYGYICHYCYFRETHQNVFVVHFDDITEGQLEFDNGNCVATCITEDDAYRMVKFINDNAGKDLYVHCMAGKSRSQAVVRYILDHYPDIYDVQSLNPANPCLYPNILVKLRLNRAYEKLMNETGA